MPRFSNDLIIRPLGEDEVSVWQTRGATTNKIFCNLDLIQTQSILRNWKNQPTTKIHSDSLELIVRLVAEGLGYGILPSRVVKLLNVNLIKCEATPRCRDIFHIVYRPEFGKAEIEREMIRALTDGFKQSEI